MWLIKVFGVLYFTALCAAQEPEDVTSRDDSPTFAPVTPTFFEPPVPSLQLLSGWLDVFPLERVEFSCSVPGSSDWTFRWFKDGQQVHESKPVVSLSKEGSVLTIMPIPAKQQESGTFSCRGQHKIKGATTGPSNTLKLDVHATMPKPTVSQNPNFEKIFSGEQVTLRCTADSSGWEYRWFHNRNKIHESKENAYTIDHVKHTDSGSYYCKVKRGQLVSDLSRPTNLEVSDPPKPSLKVKTAWLDVFPDETVGFSCEGASPDWTSSWYRNGQRLQEDSDPDIELDETSINITSVAQRHQGNYTCKTHLESRGVSSGSSNTAYVTVYKNTPTPTLHKVPGFSPMYVGETVNFTCNVDVSSGWEYQWYKDGKGRPDKSKTISIRLGSDGGKYSCKASRGETTSTVSSDKIAQDVLEIPVPSLKPKTQWLDVFPTEGVQLSCGMDGSSDWTYTWYRDGQEVRADSVVSFDSDGATLSLSSASDAHAGQFTCKGHLRGRPVSSKSSSGLPLKVYDKKPSVALMQDPEYKVMFLGESVSFSCHVNVSTGWEYVWYKDGNSLRVSGNKYTIRPIETAHRGLYTCKAKRGTHQAFRTSSSQAITLHVEVNKPKPSLTQMPDFDKVYIGESLSFECKVELSSGWEYHWYKDGAPLRGGSRLDIRNASSLNSGDYECVAVRNRTMYATQLSDKRLLNISEIPVPVLKPVTPWMDVFPAEHVQLSCGMDGSSDWTYTWYRDGQKLRADSVVSFDSDGTTLSISSASASHRGEYSCSGKHKSRPVISISSLGHTLKVYDTKPNVAALQYPDHNDMHTGDSVSFSCHVNVSTGWQYVWYKDDSTIVESGHNHTITSVATTNTGSYKCQAKRGRKMVFYSDHSQALRIDVKERPQAEIILLTGWSDVFSTNILVLKCGVQGEDQNSWNYTWFKADQALILPPSERYEVTPQNDPEQSLYTCKGIRAGRPSYSKTSAPFKTKNLLVKRRVLLSISGFIFFAIIAIFLGCIVLRIFRKPVDDYEKPAEEDLFPSMAQRTAAPCPLVEYITDAKLNASSKGEENDTMCSETTPLPISSPDEQAVTSEGDDTTESNGGLVSFKQ